MDQWVDVPDGGGDRCHRSGAQEASHGPFLREEFWFRRDEGDPRFDRREDRRVRLYTSAAQIRDFLGLPGSPFVPVTVEEWGALQAELAHLRAVQEEHDGQVEALQQRLEEAVAPEVASDPEVLARLVAARVVEGLAGAVPAPTGDVAPAVPKRSSSRKEAA